MLSITSTEAGAEQFSILGPGQSFNVNTFVTHPWLIVDGPGKLHRHLHADQEGPNRQPDAKPELR